MTFPESSIENLLSLGYTEDEARFLHVVATHSSYFSTRQFLKFTGAKSGEKSMALSADHSREALVFSSSSGVPLAANNLRRKSLGTACKRAGLQRIDWHTLRHTHGTL